MSQPTFVTHYMVRRPRAAGHTTGTHDVAARAHARDVFAQSAGSANRIAKLSAQRRNASACFVPKCGG